MVWPALYGVLTPVCLDVSDGIKILHSISDILGVEDLKEQLEITIYGDRDLDGEMVFEGPNINKIKSVTIPGETVKLVRDDKRIAITYRHKHKKEMILIIKIG
jgi:hypothetical protein